MRRWPAWQTVWRCIAAFAAIVGLVVVLTISVVFVKSNAEQARNNERLRTRLDEQQQTIGDLNTLLTRRTPIIEFIRDSERRDNCVQRLVIEADLAYSRLILTAVNLPEDQQLQTSDPVVVAYNSANMALLHFDDKCPLTEGE